MKPALISAAALLAVACWILASSVRMRLIRFAVQGRSMEPTLADGDFVAALRIRPGEVPRPGSLVVVGDPRGGSIEMVKRASAATLDGLLVQGDSPSLSTDSRHFGPVPFELVTGRVILRYWPPLKLRLFA